MAGKSPLSVKGHATLGKATPSNPSPTIHQQRTKYSKICISESCSLSDTAIPYPQNKHHSSGLYILSQTLLETRVILFDFFEKHSHKEMIKITKVT